MRPVLTMDALTQPSGRVVLALYRNGVLTRRLDFPCFPQPLRVVYTQLGYTIRDLPACRPARQPAA